MIANKIIDVILTVTSWIVLPVQLVTTFVLGILVTLTFGLLLLPFSLIWLVLFFGPLLGLSYVWEHTPFTRPLIATIGVPLAVVGNIFVCLIPAMGEIESRVVKLLYCQTFPLTWRFHQFLLGKPAKRSDSMLELEEVFRRVSKDIAIRQYLIALHERQKSDK